MSSTRVKQSSCSMNKSSASGTGTSTGALMASSVHGEFSWESFGSEGLSLACLVDAGADGV